MNNSVYALIDCNNFYASCERVFDPALRGQPVAILSNNDGCIIARSDEAQKAGIEMAVPRFKIQKLLKKKQIITRSSNYALYGDMSRRVMATLRHLTHKVEPYSIDEAFIEFPLLKNQNLRDFGHTIKSTIKQWTGLPVSVGIAPSKTLAKIANERAKSNTDLDGILNLVDNPDLDEILQDTKLTDIWGIGNGLSQRLFKEGISNAYQLKNQHSRPEWVRDRLTVKGLRTVMELNGQPCIDIEHAIDSRKGIMTSRSFGEAITKLQNLKEAVAAFTSIAAEKLRAQQSVSSLLHVTLRTNRYSKYNAKYKYGIEIPLPTPTANTSYLIKCAHAAVQKLYKSGCRYKKAAIMLTGLLPESEVQADLFNEQQYSEEQHKLMSSIDRINTKYGSDTTHFAATGIEQPWQMKQEHLSPKYTTSWDGILEAKC